MHAEHVHINIYRTKKASEKFYVGQYAKLQNLSKPNNLMYYIK